MLIRASPGVTAPTSIRQAGSILRPSYVRILYIILLVFTNILDCLRHLDVDESIPLTPHCVYEGASEGLFAGEA